MLSMRRSSVSGALTNPKKAKQLPIESINTAPINTQAGSGSIARYKEINIKT